MPAVPGPSLSPPRPSPSIPDLAPPGRAPDDARTRWWPWVATVLRVGLGAVAVVAGATKLSDLPASVRAVRAYELLPEALAVAVGTALPFVEVLLGALLVAGLLTRWAALAFGLLLVAFVVGIASAWARGLAIDCGCFGGGGEIDPDDTKYLQELVRDGALLAVAALLVYLPHSRLSLDSALDLDPVTRKDSH